MTECSFSQATYFPVENLLTEITQQRAIDETVLKRIDLAQIDHVSVSFKKGIVRIILDDISDEVGDADVFDGSYSQWLASYIAFERNLQTFIMRRHDGRYSLVVVSQLESPKDKINRVKELFQNLEIRV